MNAAMTAPEIKPNVHTILFIGRVVEDGGILHFRAGLRVTRSGDFWENG
jgi:hypothetical protein